MSVAADRIIAMVDEGRILWERIGDIGVDGSPVTEHFPVRRYRNLVPAGIIEIR